MTLIVPGPDPEEPTTVAPSARSTLCCAPGGQVQRPVERHPAQRAAWAANATPAEVAVPPVIVPPLRTIWPSGADPSNVWPELLQAPGI